MLRIKAFKALRPAGELAGQVASAPYDVVNRAEAAELAKGNPNSFLHVSRPEIDLPADLDPYSQAVYDKAREAFKRLQDNGALIREPKPCLYLYRQRMGNHVQRGLVACCHTGDYESGIIKRHELTRKDKEDDRTRHISAIQAQPGPVFLTYRDSAKIDSMVKKAETGTPLYDFKASDGVAHTVWRIAEPGPFEAAFREIPVSYIADGHHRAASAARIARERRADRASDDEAQWFLAVLFPATQLKILPYNRLVKDLNGLRADAFMAEIGRRFTMVRNAPPQPTQPRNISVFMNGEWKGLSWADEPGADPVSVLDVSVLQNRLLAPVLGIDDPRTSKRIDFVGGIRGTAELEARVRSGECAVAFSMYPTTVDQLMAIADAGLIMPPKSTWFEPKLKSGLLIHTIEPA